MYCAHGLACKNAPVALNITAPLLNQKKVEAGQLRCERMEIVLPGDGLHEDHPRSEIPSCAT